VRCGDPPGLANTEGSKEYLSSIVLLLHSPLSLEHLLLFYDFFLAPAQEEASNLLETFFLL
jgi:hypothetical protein